VRWHWYYWLLAPFTLPNVVVSLLLAVFYRPTSARWSEGCLELVAGRKKNGTTRIWGRPGGQSLGCQVIWYASERQRARRDLCVHERVHTVHGFWLLGVPFGIAYGAHFLWEWARQGFGPWKPAYYRIWSERIAYRVQDEFQAGQRPDAWGN